MGSLIQYRFIQMSYNRALNWGKGAGGGGGAVGGRGKMGVEGRERGGD